VEGSDAPLAAALLRATAAPSAAAHRAVALEYRRLAVFDKAHDAFERAIALDPADAVSHEWVARIWRDWGTPQFGLPPAYRAVYHAPRSAAAANTLGTVLQALGRLPEAEGLYVRALALAPDAWYALNNICYVQIMRRQASAIESCRRAVAAAGPGVSTPTNNLALAHAAAGDMPGARQWFKRAGDPATAHYNYGIALMATREYAGAAAAFADSLSANPTSTLAAARAHQARLAAAQSQEPVQ
jgi:tetratricopeptide (TPR) repeat protein